MNIDYNEEILIINDWKNKFKLISRIKLCVAILCNIQVTFTGLKIKINGKKLEKKK